MHNSVHMAKELYLAKYTMRKCQIKMQWTFYTPKQPN